LDVVVSFSTLALRLDAQQLGSGAAENRRTLRIG